MKKGKLHAVLICLIVTLLFPGNLYSQFIQRGGGGAHRVTGWVDDTHNIFQTQDEGKSFQFMLYPNGRHGWGGAEATHSANERNKFWLSSFFDKQPLPEI